jgi:orotate phosphoribosyltransferase
VQETIDIALAHKANVLGVAMAVDRSNGAFILNVPMFSLLTMRVAAYPADRVPADLAAIPAVKPGSK